MTNFPTSLDDTVSLPNPGSDDNTDSPSHSNLHTSENGAIKAVETKLGTGSSVPASNTLLTGTGAGTSAWSTLTSAALRGILTDETGTGSAVFATSPTISGATLVTPAVDTITESTSANGVTVDALNIKDGKLNTNNSVVTTNITDSAVTTAKIADSAVTTAKVNNTAITKTKIDLTTFFNSNLEVQSSTGSVNIVSTSATASTAINFAKTFSGAPTILINPTSSNATAILSTFSATSITTTGFTLNGRNTGATGSVGFVWLAIYAPVN